MKKNNIRKQEANNRLKDISKLDINKSLEFVESSLEGLNEEEVNSRQDDYGKNEITKKNKNSIWKRLFDAFINPFSLILISLSIISLITDVILPPEKDPSTFIIIMVLVLVSGIIRLVQETRSGNEASKIAKMVTTTTCVKRKDEDKKEIPLSEVTIGDVIYLAAGDMIPADLRIIQSKDLFISESSFTGESEPIEKTPTINSDDKKALLEINNLAFMGSNVISGSGIGIVVNIGDDTVLGSLSNSINKKKEKTSFEKGVNSVSWVLIVFMLVMVPIVFLINGLTKKDWIQALLFAISIAVGLTPEMLPMIVTTCLAKGSVKMSKEKVIIKNLNSIQDLGSIDVLCTDKTGTLTQDKVVLEYHMDITGKEDERVLRHAFLNSYYQTGLRNLIDNAVISYQGMKINNNDEFERLKTKYSKVDEIPFDFERRRMSVVVKDNLGKTQMITKGALEEILSISTYVEYQGQVVPLNDDLKRICRSKAGELASKGMRVIAVSQKTNPPSEGVFSTKDESDMVLIGFLAFLDPPKETAYKAIKALSDHGISVKVLTGDSDRVTKYICSKVGIDASRILLGTDIEDMDDKKLSLEVEKVNVFAKLSPEEKARVVTALRNNGHSVGYMGDGINDTAALKAADVGISVDTGTDITKESAGIILLEKDLMILDKGVMEGRKTYVNMIKYIKMTASSNFGNMFSVLIASAFLPFLPMQPIHLLLLNLLYDISCISLPWDNVDPKYLLSPRKWDAKSVTRFMLFFGPVSSIFDICTYALMYFLICPNVLGGSYNSLTDPSAQKAFTSLFQSGWFIESIWTQTLVIHMLRTEKIPFIQSRPSKNVVILTSLGILIATVIPFTFIGERIGLSSLPWYYFGYLVLFILGYSLLITLMKNIYVKKYKTLL